MPTEMKVPWELAGLTTPDGHIDRPIPPGDYLIPDEVSLDGDNVTWSSRFRPEFAGPNGRLLDRFVRLAEKEPKDILAFVKEYGPLDLRRYMKPFLLRCLATLPERQDARATDAELVEFSESFFRCKLPEGLGTRGSEPLSVYRALSRFVRSVMNDAAEIHSGALTGRDWLVRYPYHCDDCASGFDRAIQNVENAVNNLLKIGEVSFRLDWPADRWQIEIRCWGLLAAIAAKLMMAVTRSDLYTCTGCGAPYNRSATITERKSGRVGTRMRRRPKPGERNYCSECGLAAAQLDAKRRYRQKMADAQRLRADGLGLREIAAKLDTGLANVRRWIRK